MDECYLLVYVFFPFFKLSEWYQIAQSVSYTIGIPGETSNIDIIRQMNQ